MAIERWTDERLDNLASTVADLRTTSEALLQTAIIHQQGLETSQRNFEAIVTEIRGLQTENRRILDHLFGEQNNE
jgi:hypothetical protein